MIWEIPDEFPYGFRVDVLADPDLFSGCCEYNCNNYVQRFGGAVVEGVYILRHKSLDLYQLIRHYIIWDGEGYLDITPFNDSRIYNWFVPIKIFSYNTYIQSPETIYTIKDQEIECMYYVYCYIDKTTGTPIYVGKGTQDRAYVHLKHATGIRKNRNTTRFLNKIESMIADGNPPEIIYLAQNIEDENVAYDIEESFISQYGRKGYDENGILLNICKGSRPPNHKGKSYEEIYGDRADEQRRIRHSKQLEAGGWFRGKTHSEETKRKYREQRSGSGNSNYGKTLSEETRKKISDANKGKSRISSSYEVLLTNTITGDEYMMYMCNLKHFCKDFNLSESTLRSQISLGRPTCKYGKTKGWNLKRI